MTKLRHFRSLSFKLALMLLIAALCSICIWLLTQVAGNALIDRYYLSGEAVSRRVSSYISHFRTFVSQGNISSTDAEAVGRWSRDHIHVGLVINGKNAVLSADQAGVEMIGSSSNLFLRNGLPAEEDGTVFTVNFSDGPYSVILYDYSENRLRRNLRLGAIGLGCAVFLIMMLAYNQKLTRHIQRLSGQVRQVSRGDLSLVINPTTRDELGALAQDVDTMRSSIIEQLQREETAWTANSQLITAISHDVRTPLTALIGYLDILAASSGLTPDQQRSYLDICRRKAAELKDLTGELFGYFLVFGQPVPEMHPEEFDAILLLEQILGELTADLRQRGFDVRTSPLTESCRIRVDVQHLRRIFDNLFSNVTKYANPEKPVSVSAALEPNRLQISIRNHIASNVGKVESNKIGLQTCTKLTASMGGQFIHYREGGVFTAQVFIPLLEQDKS